MLMYIQKSLRAADLFALGSARRKLPLKMHWSGKMRIASVRGVAESMHANVHVDYRVIWRTELNSSACELLHSRKSAADLLPYPRSTTMRRGRGRLVGRSARTGRFTTVRKARSRKSTHVVHRMSKGRGRKKK
jgi:hypothetical protein